MANLTAEQLEADLLWLEAEPGDRAYRRWPAAIKTALALIAENEKLMRPRTPVSTAGGWSFTVAPNEEDVYGEETFNFSGPPRADGFVPCYFCTRSELPGLASELMARLHTKEIS